MLKFCANCCTMKYTLATSLDLENNLAWIFLYSILIKRSKVKEKERYTRLHFAYSTNRRPELVLNAIRPLNENLTRPHKERIPKNVDWPRWKPRLSTSCCREFDGWDKHGHFRHRYPTGLALSLVPFLTNCEFSTRKRISYLLIDIFWISCWIRLLSISIINEESLIIVSSDSVFQAVECKK